MAVRREINRNIFLVPEFLVVVGLSDAVDSSLSQLCHSHLQHTFPGVTSGKKGAGMKFAAVTKVWHWGSP
jgi:hypothetical protein